MRRLLPLLILTTCPTIVSGQVLQWAVGGGSMFTGTPGGGIGITRYSENTTEYAGLSFDQGRVSVGGYKEVIYRGFDTTVGTKMLGFSSGGVGIGLSELGIAAKRRYEDSSLSVFTGLSGRSAFLPYANGMSNVQHIAFGGLYEIHLPHSLDFSTMEVINGNSKTAAQGVTYRYRQKFLASGSGGIVTNNRFFEGVAQAHPLSFLNLSASHQSFFVPFSATGNNVSGYMTLGKFSVNSSYNTSNALGRSSAGESFGAGFRSGWFQASTGFYTTKSRSLINSFFVEKFQHYMLTENVTRSAGQTSLSLGGGYTRNRFSINIGRSIQFLLTGQYQQVTSIQVSFRVRDTQISAASTVDPYGRALWGAYSDTYNQIGNGLRRETHSTTSGYAIRGICKNKFDNSPMEGCALLIGHDIYFSRRDGSFEIRVKKKTMSVDILIDPEQFTAPGDWRVIYAPTQISPGQGFTIVVARKLRDPNIKEAAHP